VNITKKDIRFTRAYMIGNRPCRVIQTLTNPSKAIVRMIDDQTFKVVTYKELSLKLDRAAEISDLMQEFNDLPNDDPKKMPATIALEYALKFGNYAPLLVAMGLVEGHLAKDVMPMNYPEWLKQMEN
jgi:hypothetical protein